MPSGNMTRKTDSALGYRFSNQALFLTQILTQNRKVRCGRGSTKGKLPFQYPYGTAPNGRFSAEKTPWPILLSSRSGVRVPPGVPLIWQMSGRTAKLRNGIELLGLEPFKCNSPVDCCSRRLDGATPYLTSPSWRAKPTCGRQWIVNSEKWIVKSYGVPSARF